MSVVTELASQAGSFLGLAEAMWQGQIGAGRNLAASAGGGQDTVWEMSLHQVNRSYTGRLVLPSSTPTGAGLRLHRRYVTAALPAASWPTQAPRSCGSAR